MAGHASACKVIDDPAFGVANATGAAGGAARLEMTVDATWTENAPLSVIPVICTDSDDPLLKYMVPDLADHKERAEWRRKRPGFAGVMSVPFTDREESKCRGIPPVSCTLTCCAHWQEPGACKSLRHLRSRRGQSLIPGKNRVVAPAWNGTVTCWVQDLPTGIRSRKDESSAHRRTQEFAARFSVYRPVRRNAGARPKCQILRYSVDSETGEVVGSTGSLHQSHGIGPLTIAVLYYRVRRD